MKESNAVEFATNSRIHVALEVSELARSVEFYRALLGIDASKERPGYAKFEAADPPVNLALNEGPRPGPAPGGAAHHGIQVKTAGAVREAKDRLESAGVRTREENRVTCCYSLQDKIWSTDPDGNAWEVFVVLDPEAREYSGEDATSCCVGEKTSTCCETAGESCCVEEETR